MYFVGVGLPAQKLLHARVCAVSDFFRTAGSHDSAIVHYNDPICYFEGALKFVGDHHDSHSHGFRANSRIKRSRPAAVMGSRPEEGSSTNSISGSMISALASPALFFIPPLIWEGI